MGANFSRVKTWVAEILTASDLNAEFNNILNNLDPDGVDDASVSDAAMQAVADPYPGSSISKPTSLRGEIHRLRYMVAQITGQTYWYLDPSATLPTSGKIMVGDGGTTKSWFYLNTAPTGWTVDSTPADALLAVKGGSQAFNANGGTQQGTWTHPNHTHDMSSHTHTGPSHTHTSGNCTLSASESGVPSHNHGLRCYGGSGGIGFAQVTTDTSYTAAGVYTETHAGAGASSAHSHGATGSDGTGATGGPNTANTGNGATANTWRPLSQLGIICTLTA